MWCWVTLMRNKINFFDFSKWLQWNKEFDSGYALVVHALKYKITGWIFFFKDIEDNRRATRTYNIKTTTATMSWGCSWGPAHGCVWLSVPVISAPRLIHSQKHNSNSLDSSNCIEIFFEYCWNFMMIPNRWINEQHHRGEHSALRMYPLSVRPPPPHTHTHTHTALLCDCTHTQIRAIASSV